MNALLIIDVQNDFCPGGALAVPDGDKVIPIINKLQRRFDHVIATQDWHPLNHGSFATNHPGKKPGDVIQLAGLNQILWPVHCVQKTPGAELVASLETDLIENIIQKGTDPEIDSYSGFFDNGHRKATGLADYLKHKGIISLYLGGLATDYCVKFTAKDAAALGLKVSVIEDACRAVNLRPGDSDRAFDEMRKAGVKIVSSDKLNAGV